jgi:hypothetical protein
MAQQFTHKDTLNDFFEKLKQELLIDIPTTFYFILFWLAKSLPIKPKSKKDNKK